LSGAASGVGLAAAAFFALAGPFAGDYVATFAAAWPRAPTPLFGRSRCARCAAPIPLRHAIPMVSWLALRGMRPCCDGRIPVVYPLGEAAGLAAGLAAAMQVSPAAAAWTFAVGLTLAYVALVDLRRFAIPWWGLAALALELAAAIAAEPATAGRLTRLAAGGALALAFEALRRLSALGRRSGMGFGDVMLVGLLGGLVDWRLAAPMVSLAALAPLAIQYIGRKFGPVPFGFWLCASTGFFLLLVEAAMVAEVHL
jgi:leader peptidase (prepilin peptidase)/N-methyltransferase